MKLPPCPIFRAFYRLKRKTDLVTCGRNAGTFKEPLYILKENIGIKEWPHSGMDKNDARAYIINKLIASFGVTYPVHISHITGIPTAEVKPFFVRLEQEGKISPVKVGKSYTTSNRPREPSWRNLKEAAPGTARKCASFPPWTFSCGIRHG